MLSLRITSQTQVTGVIGHPISHSLSPLMHNRVFEYLDLDWVYLPFDVAPQNLEEAIKGMRGLGIRGLNVTIPHKERVIPFLDEVSPEAETIEAVNTILNEEGKLIGYNTDVPGFVRPLKDFEEKLRGKKAVILGAGGASRAVIYALLKHFDLNQISVINRTLEKAERLAERFRGEGCEIRAFGLTEENLEEQVPSASLVVNCTSVGMFPEVNGCVIKGKRLLKKGQIVYDLVYNPLETRLLKLAKERGAIPIPGLEMLLQQGAESFKIWTGVQMPLDSIREELRFELEEILLAGHQHGVRRQ